MILYHGKHQHRHYRLVEIQTIQRFRTSIFPFVEREQATKMAEAKVVQFGGEEAVTAFEFEERNMNKGELQTKIFEGYTREWAEFVFRNRDESQQFEHHYDIVYGPIADDYIGLQIRDFKRHAITFEQFLQNIHFHKGITYQYAFCTQEAVDLLIRV